MSKPTTLFLLLSITSLIVLSAASHRGSAQVPNVPPAMNAPAAGSNSGNALPQKTYKINRGSAQSVRARLETMMPDEVKRFTVFSVDEQTNSLTVQGPPAALEMADQCVPRTQMFVPGTIAGTFTPYTQMEYGGQGKGTVPGKGGGVPVEGGVPAKYGTFLCGMIYHCSATNVQAFKQELQKIFGNDPTIIFDVELPQNAQSFVRVSFLAPEDVQPKIAKTLYDMGVLLSDQVEEHENVFSVNELQSDEESDNGGVPNSHGVPAKYGAFTPQRRSISYMDQTLQAALGKRFVRLNSLSNNESASKNPIARREDSGSSPSHPKRQSSGTAIYEYRARREARSNLQPQVPSLARLELNYDRKIILLEGDKSTCEQIRLLIETIDKPNPGEGLDRKIITIRGKHAEHIRKFAVALALKPGPLNSWKQSTATQHPIRQVAWKPQQDQTGSLNAPTMDAPPQQFPQQLPQQQLPPQQFGTGPPQMGGQPQMGQMGAGPPQMGGQPQMGQMGAGPPQMGGQPQMGQMGAGQMGAGQMGQFAPPPYYGGQEGGQGFDIPQSLQIRVLPALDIILFEGTNADSERLQKMIADIEEMMEESKSQMVVVQLEHTDCVSMNEMLYDMQYLLFFAQKRGRVNLFPLRNPNALMVVGWGSAYDEMLNLIKTLDKPITQPGSTWKVIRLKYVSATYASNMIRNLFVDVPNVPVGPLGQHVFGYGWLPRIRVSADVRTNSLIINAGPNDIKEVEHFLRKIDLYESGPEMRIQKFTLKNSLANDVAAMLTKILSPGTSGIGVAADQKFPQFVIEKLGENEKRLIKSGIVTDFTINADPQHNAVIVNAPEYALPLIGELIELIDSPMPVARVLTIPLYNGDAEQVMKILTNIIIPQQLQGQLSSRLSGAQGETNFIPLRFASDVRSNMIIAVGSEKDLEIVQALVMQLDKEEAEKRVKQVYTLKNAQAKDVADAIRNYVTQKQNFYRTAPGVKSPYLQIEEALIVVPEVVTNSLLIDATPKYLDEILEIIEDFDRQPDQVVIQALIAEITCSNADEFGAEFGIQDSILFRRSTFDKSFENTTTTTVTRSDGTTSTVTKSWNPAGDGNPGFAFGNAATPLGNNLNALSESTVGTVAPQMLTSFDMGRTGTETGFGGMVFSASSDSVSILIRALQERKRLEILSRPQITAMDNQMAFILVGQRVPRVGDTTVSNGIAQGSVIMEEVGLMLMVTPRISPDGKVVMHIGAEKSSLGSTADGIPIPSGTGTVNSPKISAITTMTDICASNNETVLLGGLLTKDTENVNRRVPYLADIPVLGRLFQYRLETIKKTELIIILTPRIVKHTKPGETSKDAALIKREEAARIHWCLNDVLKMHGSSTGDIGIWDSTAEQPVSGRTQPIYPKTPFNRDDLELLVPESQPDPERMVNPLQDSSLDLDLSMESTNGTTTRNSQPTRLNSNSNNTKKTAPTPAPFFRRAK